MEYRIEHDSMGEVRVPADKLWGAQTERSHENFKIGVGIETMPREITHAFGILKKACAMANHALKPEKMTEAKLAAISAACDEVIAGKLNDHFPLVVWQTGSGTQSNMNANEVIARRGTELAGDKLEKALHPNDDINMSQSSNDTFPTAMHIAAVLTIEDKLFPAIDKLIATLKRLEEENEGIVKSGRTHLQDATPIKFSQEISGWRSSLEKDKKMLEIALPELHELALGGTAVGTGLNTPKGFDVKVADAVADGLISSALVERLNELEERKVELEAEISQLETLAGAITDLVNVDDIIPRYKLLRNSNNFLEYRSFLQRFISRIDVGRYMVDITLNTGLGIFDNLNTTISVKRQEIYEKKTST